MNKAKVKLKKKIYEWLNITLGVAIAAFAFSFFLNPNNIVIGGVSGIGIIIKNIFNGYEPALVILVLNIFLLLLGLLLIGKEFFIKTAYGSLTFPLFIMVFDWFLKVTEIQSQILDLNMVLTILFSSILMGGGLGLVVKHGGTTGGTDILQRILFKYFHLPFSASLYILDGTVIFAGFLLGVTSLEIFLYAIVFTYISGFVMDNVVFSGFNRRAVYIISKKNEEIKHHILHDFERGVTSIKVIGEYSKNDREMLVCVLSSSEYYKLRDYVERKDPTAFLFVVRASEVRGEGFSYD